MPESFRGHAIRRTRQPFILSRFRGWNDDQNNSALEDADLRTAQNVFLERANLLRSRYGYYIDPFGAALNSGAGITGIFDFTSESDGTQHTIVCAGNAIYHEDESTDPSTATAITGTAPQADDDNVFVGTTFKDQLILTQSDEAGGGLIGGGGVPHVVTNAAPPVTANISNWYADARKPAFCHTQWNFLFFAGYDAASPSSTHNSMTVNYSELNDETTWLEQNFVDKVGGLSIYGDEYVTALFRHRDFLMIGTNRRIYPVAYTGAFFGSVADRFQVQRPLEVGVAHQRTVASINSEFTFFMDPNGRIHSIREAVGTFGDVGTRDLSRKVRNYISTWNRSRIRYAHAQFLSELGVIVWFVNNGTEALVLDVNNFPLNEPDPDEASWFKWTNVAANCSAVMRRAADTADTDTAPASRDTTEPDTDGNESLYFGTTTGWLKKFSDAVSFDESDAAVNATIETLVETKYFDFAVPDRRKKVVRTDWNMQPASTNPGPNATWLYDFGRSQSNTVSIDMDTNVGSVFTYDSGVTYDSGATYSGLSRTARSKTRFVNGGEFASLRLQQFISGTTDWKLQAAVVLVELSGVVKEGGSA